jgi:tetratricopeptide (TPR) repeat protein
MAKKSKASLKVLRAGCLVLLAVFGLLRPALAADAPSAPEAAPIGPQDFLRSYLQIQEQLHDAQLAIEKNRQEAAAAAASNSLVLNERLESMEKNLANERLEQVRAIEHSDRMILFAAGIFAAIGFLVMLLAALLQWTAVNRLAAAASAVSPRSSPLLGMGETQLPPLPALEQSSTRFLGLIERLEQRIHELESSLPEAGSANGKSNGADTHSSPREISAPAAPDNSGTIQLLVSKSQTLLKLDKPEAALACFDEILTLEPTNAEILVKKGSALERLRRFDEAIQCYDRAIAQDDSLALAYLYKGGLCHRMERYSEALACYELALKPAKTTRPAAAS